MSNRAEKFRLQVDQRRDELKKALVAAERDGQPEEVRAFIDLDLHTVESTLRKGWEQAVPEELAGLKTWLAETRPEVVSDDIAPAASDDHPAKPTT